MNYWVILLLSYSWIAVGADILGSQVVTVGSTPDCDFTNIQAAINTEPDEIRVSEAVYEQNLYILNQDLIINGAFLDCKSAANGDENGFRSFIQGTAPILPVIRIIGDKSRHEVTIKNMSFSGGNGVDIVPGGGISTYQADLQLNLENISLFDNNGISGGGIAVVDGNTNVKAVDLQVANNSADKGGGIYCTGSNNSFIISDTGRPDMGIVANQANSGDGGGVLVSNGCEFTSYMGSSVSDSFEDFRGINRNFAAGKGGGIAVESGAKLYLKGYMECFDGACIGNNQDAVTVGENESGGVGGGISAQGSNTLVEAYAFNIFSNSAISGGGISVEQNAELVTDNLRATCWNQSACNLINNNRASFTGGGLYAQSGAVINLAKTFFTRSRADLAVVASVWGNAILNLESSLVAFNGNLGTGGFDDDYLFNVFSGGLLNIRFSTIARNRVPTEMIRNGGTRVILLGSIIYEPGSDIYTTVPSGLLNANCLVLNEDESISGSNLVVGDPAFVSPLNGDFLLSPNSIAIDLCAPNNDVLQDFNLNSRGFDVTSIPDIDGAFDTGAYEFRSDRIFRNGFELIDM